MNDDFFETNKPSYFSSYKWWITIASLMGAAFIIWSSTKEKTIEAPKKKHSTNTSINSPVSTLTTTEKNSFAKPSTLPQTEKEAKVVENNFTITTEKPLPISSSSTHKVEIIPTKEQVNNLKDNNLSELTPQQKRPIIVEENSLIQKKNSISEQKREYPTTISFKPEFGESAQIPVAENSTGKIAIYNRAGILVWSDVLVGENNYNWDGKNNQGGISATGLYHYQLDYSSENKSSGQLLIY